MAIQMLPRSMNRGANIAQDVGQGISSALQGLLTNKVQEMQQKKQASMLGPILGMDNKQSQSFLLLPPNLQQEIIKQKMQAPGRQAMGNALSSIVGTQSGAVGGNSGQGIVKDLGAEETNTAPVDLSNVSPQQAIQLAQMQMKKQIAQRKEYESDKKLSFTETRKFRQDSSEAAKNAKSDRKNLSEQLKLIDSGKLLGPKETVFLEFVGDKLGLDKNQIDAFKNPETQIFEKLSVPYFRNLKRVFGARPTQWDAQQFQKGFPTLYQSDEGKKVIAYHMDADSKIEIANDRISREITRRNRGIPPIDLEDRTNIELDKFREKVYKKLKEKTSKVLVETAGPGGDPAKFKGKKVASENGVEFISDGKSWKVDYS